MCLHCVYISVLFICTAFVFNCCVCTYNACVYLVVCICSVCVRMVVCIFKPFVYFVVWLFSAFVFLDVCICNVFVFGCVCSCSAFVFLDVCIGSVFVFVCLVVLCVLAAHMSIWWIFFQNSWWFLPICMCVHLSGPPYFLLNEGLTQQWTASWLVFNTLVIGHSSGNNKCRQRAASSLCSFIHQTTHNTCLKHVLRSETKWVESQNHPHIC